MRRRGGRRAVVEAGKAPAAAAVALAAALGLAGGPDDPPEELTSALERARGAAQALGSDLMKALMAELAAGGPPQAVKVCAEVAQARTREHSRDGLTVRRVTLKPRNPADVPDDYERRALERLAERHAEGTLPEEHYEIVGQGTERRLRYLKPIRIAEPCLACHGSPEAISPEVREILVERYPEDQATGYARGDLRGAISVAVTLPGPGSE